MLTKPTRKDYTSLKNRLGTKPHTLISFFRKPEFTQKNIFFLSRLIESIEFFYPRRNFLFSQTRPFCQNDSVAVGHGIRGTDLNGLFKYGSRLFISLQVDQQGSHIIQSIGMFRVNDQCAAIIFFRTNYVLNLSALVTRRNLRISGQRVLPRYSMPVCMPTGVEK